MKLTIKTAFGCISLTKEIQIGGKDGVILSGT